MKEGRKKVVENEPEAERELNGKKILQYEIKRNRNEPLKYRCAHMGSLLSASPPSFHFCRNPPNLSPFPCVLSHIADYMLEHYEHRWRKETGGYLTHGGQQATDVLLHVAYGRTICNQTHSRVILWPRSCFVTLIQITCLMTLSFGQRRWALLKFFCNIILLT